MCGLAAVFPAGPDAADTVRRICARQRHRGPDAQEVWQQPDAVLGHTRLAIVDLTAAGWQPFRSGDADVAVIYNGEIYNHESLRKRYGLRVESGCDGAILPDLWRQLGTRMLTELRGMYSMVIYDARDRSLTLARDPFGIKPLYWTRAPRGAISVASEPRVLAQVTGSGRVRREALHHYLAYGSLARDMSPFAGVEAVPANGWLRFSWDGSGPTPGSGPPPLSQLPAVGLADLRATFLDSVAAHLLSDVPMALLLSSGVDSAALAWAVREAGVSLTGLTVGIGYGPREDQIAAGIARRYGHDHLAVSRPPTDELIGGFFAAMQRPTIDGLNTYLISRVVGELGIKVALSGLGGDEVLGGYRHFRHLPALRVLRLTDRVGLGRALAMPRVHRSVSRVLGPKGAILAAGGGARDAASYGLLRRRILLDHQLSELDPKWVPSAQPPVKPEGLSARHLSEGEIVHYLGGTLLPDADSFSMCWSVELRVPYVDVPFASVALSLDPRRGVGKRRFASALGDAAIVDAAARRKRGFTLPMDDWMRSGPLRAHVGHVRSDAAVLRSLLAPPAIDGILAGWDAGRVSWSRVWLLAALEGWLRSLDSILGQIT